MKEASEAIKKAIETIESAAPEAWRLTVEGYTGELHAQIAHDGVMVTGLAVVILLCALAFFLGVWGAKARDWNDGAAACCIPSVLVAVFATFLVGVYVADVQANKARLDRAEGYAAKQIMEAALR